MPYTNPAIINKKNVVGAKKKVVIVKKHYSVRLHIYKRMLM